MKTSSTVSVQSRVGLRLTIWLATIVVASVASVSAHFVKGLGPSGSTSAFVSSPTDAADVPLAVKWGTEVAGDTGLRIVCFYVANTSAPQTHRLGWPRITGVGFELPGALSGFSLLDPSDGDWELAEGVKAWLPDHGAVKLDFAIVARLNPKGKTPWHSQMPRGIPPGQQGGVRGVGTRFCVSGPFPDALPGVGSTNIERILNSVVVGFEGAGDDHRGSDVGVWFPTPAGTTGPGPIPRAIPLYE